MPRYDDYDDLMGLDYYDGLDQFVTPAMVRDSLIAAGAGAGAILLASWVVPMIPAPKDWEADPEKMKNMSRLRAVVGAVGGLLVGRLVWDFHRDAAMAIIGGTTGLGIAQLVDSYFEKPALVGTPFGTLPEDIELSGDEALLGAYDYGPALSNLETTGVTTAPGAFADPTVTPEALFGMEGTVVQQETLGYNPYMA